MSTLASPFPSDFPTKGIGAYEALMYDDFTSQHKLQLLHSAANGDEIGMQIANERPELEPSIEQHEAWVRATETLDQ